MSVKVVALVTLKPDADDAFLAAASTCAAASRGEAGTLHYEIWRETDGERRVVFNELYVDEEAVEQHMASDHFKAFGRAAADLWTAPPTIIVTHPVDID
ncbi:antibiotic biosynthesis monooxygenase [Sphingomonas prati]|uniref:Quinol monooxygenase YgiN n=2 Tax=Sphingomonas prati TaxID=1843237 RepID=A0A7W9BUV9_9SPHN|nr:putative quinol monooxygenase [Sphingomonas prati]MBB5730542.1 quinol monooxygenase YgiN [Sphingomonas prati]GGE94840.1 antibiotic biosynthesis monooxygenase [Sphingomonas prati]